MGPHYWISKLGVQRSGGGECQSPWRSGSPTLVWGTKQRGVALINQAFLTKNRVVLLKLPVVQHDQVR